MVYATISVICEGLGCVGGGQQLYGNPLHIALQTIQTTMRISFPEADVSKLIDRDIIDHNVAVRT